MNHAPSPLGLVTVGATVLALILWTVWILDTHGWL